MWGGVGAGNLAVISGFLDDLRCHPVWSTYEGISLGHRARDLSCDSKVSDFHLPRLCDQQIASLYVSVKLQAMRASVIGDGWVAGSASSSGCYVQSWTVWSYTGGPYLKH